MSESKRTKLGVNIDHIATIRNARAISTPDPFRALQIIKDNGADSVTIHLREDRRHIKDDDTKRIIEANILPVNLELAPNKQMLQIALDLKPWYVCFVPEKREEITTESGLDVIKYRDFLQDATKRLHDVGVKTSYFIDCYEKYVDTAMETQADAVEIHTGFYAEQYINNYEGQEWKDEFNKISRIVKYCNDSNKILANVGHGLDYNSTQELNKIDGINEFNIGHFMIGESIFEGLGSVTRNMVKRLG